MERYPLQDTAAEGFSAYGPLDVDSLDQSFRQPVLRDREVSARGLLQRRLFSVLDRALTERYSPLSIAVWWQRGSDCRSLVCRHLARMSRRTHMSSLTGRAGGVRS